MNIDEEAAKAACSFVTAIQTRPLFSSTIEIEKEIATVITAFGRRCVKAEREALLEVVRSEPEFPDEMPAEMYRAMQDASNLKALAEDFCRGIVRVTKQCILERMEAQAIQRREGK